MPDASRSDCGIHGHVGQPPGFFPDSVTDEIPVRLSCIQIEGMGDFSHGCSGVFSCRGTFALIGGTKMTFLPCLAAKTPAPITEFAHTTTSAPLPPTPYSLLLTYHSPPITPGCRLLSAIGSRLCGSESGLLRGLLRGIGKPCTPTPFSGLGVGV
jgi:hypothetical protein